MSVATIQDTIVKFVALTSNLVTEHFGKFFWSENVRKDYGEKKRLLALFQVMSGWAREAYGVVSVRKISQELAQKAISEREATMKFLAESKNPEDHFRLSVLRKVWMKDGKMIRPIFDAISCNRRGSFYIDYLVECEKNGIPLQLEIPYSVYNVDDARRFEVQDLENRMKLAGNKRLEPEEELTTALKYYQLGYRNVDFRSKFSDPGDKSSTSKGVKYFHICEANEVWPELELIKRFQLPEGHASRLQLSRVRAADLGPLVRRAVAQKKRTVNLPLTPGEEKMEPVIQEEIDKQISSWQDGSKAPAMMAKKVMEKIAVSDANSVVGQIIGGVLKADKTALEPFIENADVYKLLGEQLAKHGKTKVHSALVSIK